jgi:hypothetical protein
MFHNPEILTIWHFRKVVPLTEGLLFTPPPQIINERGRFQIYSKQPPKVSERQPLQLSPDPFSSTSSTSSVVKIPGNTEEDPDDPEPADGGDIQILYPSH